MPEGMDNVSVSKVADSEAGLASSVDAPDVEMMVNTPKPGLGEKLGNGVSGMMDAARSGIGSLFSGIGAGAAAVGGAVSKGVAFVAGGLNVSNTVASVLLVGALAAGGGALAVVGGNVLDPTIYAQRSGGDVDCQQVIDDASKKYGYGEREIPEMVGQYYLGRVNTVEFTIKVGLDGGGNWVGWRGNGTPQSEVGAWAEANGAEDERGFSMVDDYYIAAVAPAAWGKTEDEPAHVGDWVTVYMENGESFEMVIGDTKGDIKDDNASPPYDWMAHNPEWDTAVNVMTPTGPAVITAWGHVVGDTDVDIIEFWGEPSKINMKAYELMGFGGQRPVSFTNHGLAPELAQWTQNGSLFESAESNDSHARQKGMNEAANQCKVDCPQNYDNSSAAMAALSFAYSQSADYYRDGLGGTETWHEVYDLVIPEDGHSYPRSCDRCVCGAIRWSGTDDDYPPGNTDYQLVYCLTHPEKWEEIPYTPGSHDFTDLQPGDVFVNNGHTSLYVSEELVKEFEYTGDANIGAPPAGAFSVSASLDNRAPGTGLDDASHVGARVFRCINPTGEASKYADGSVNVSAVSTKGCDGSKRSRKELDKESRRTDHAKVAGWVEPLEHYTVTSEWGWRTRDFDGSGAAELHGGIDLGAPEGTPIVAAGPGTVSACSYDGGQGNHVHIQHDNGMVTYYMHMQKQKAGLKVGDKVEAGEVIGYVGQTGDAFGAHLHFTTMESGENVNPRRFFDFPALGSSK